MWDGVQWISTLSPDGRLRWDGQRWVPLQSGGVPAPLIEHRASRQPTPWTRPMQYAVTAYWVLAAIYAVSSPFMLGGVMTQAVNQSIQHQQSLYPDVTPPPAGFTDMMNTMFTYAFAVSAVIGFAFCVLGIVASIRRWTWAYWAMLVLFGLGILGVLIDAVELVLYNALPSLYGGISLPAWVYVVGIVFGLIDTGLFIWMLIAIVRYGPWAMKRVEA